MTMMQCLSAITSVRQCLYGDAKDKDWKEGWEEEASDSLLRSRVTTSKDQPRSRVVLDTASMAREAVVVKNCTRLCGNGAVRASSAVVQDKAYWEVRVLVGGAWSAGLCAPDTDLNTDPGRDLASWVLTSGGQVMARGAQIYTTHKLEEGDVLGFSYDHAELNIFCNGKNLNIPVHGIKGEVYPVFYVDEGANLECLFEDFQYSPPNGFERIMNEKALMNMEKLSYNLTQNNNEDVFEI